MLDENGLQRPSYQELLSVQNELSKQLFGEDIDTSETTFFGKLNRLQVYLLAQIYEELETTYYARFPNTASGLSLDRLMVFAGISRNPALAARHNIKFTGTPDYEIEAGTLVKTEDNITFYTMTSITLDSNGEGTGLVECTERGKVGNIVLGSINQIVNPSIFITSVIDTGIKRLGTETETDYALRNRFKEAIAGVGSGTAEAIKGAIMKVDNVNGVVIVENDTMETDSEGRPAKSFECFVNAPDESDQDIAEAIFSRKPVGIKTYGNTTKTVVDSGGFLHEINFTHVKEVELELSITIETDKYYTNNGANEIKTNISQYVSTFKNGQDVIITSLCGEIYKVSGVRRIANIIITGATGDRYVITNREVARIPAEKITITVRDYTDKNSSGV